MHVKHPSAYLLLPAFTLGLASLGFSVIASWGQTALPIIDPKFEGIDAMNGVPAGNPWTYEIGPTWLEDETDSNWGTCEDAGYVYPGNPQHQAKIMQIGKTDYSVYQYLFGEQLQPFTRYLFTVALGKRVSWASVGESSTNNLATFAMYVGNPSTLGGTMIMERTVNWWNFVGNNAEIRDFSVETITGASPPSGTIVVELRNPAVSVLLNNGQTGVPRAHFDNLSLTAEFMGPTEVKLGIRRYSATLIRLDWPSAAMGWSLQASDSITSGFTTLNPVIFTEGDDYAVYEELSSAPRMYRLTKDP